MAASNRAGDASTEDVEQFGYSQELKRSLTFTDLLVYGLIFMVPIAPFGIFGVVFQASGGMVALAYVPHRRPRGPDPTSTRSTATPGLLAGG